MDPFGALNYMASGCATMSISGNSRIPPIMLSVPGPLTGPYVDMLPQLACFLENWDRLVRTAGLTSTANISFNELRNADDAWLAADLMFNPKTTAFMEFQANGDDYPEQIEGIYFNSGSLADVAISYSTKVTFKQTDDEVRRFRSVSFEPLDVRPVVADISEYGAEQSQLYNIVCLIDPSNMTREFP
jgi:hypothetical protein